MARLGAGMSGDQPLDDPETRWHAAGAAATLGAGMAADADLTDANTRWHAAGAAATLGTAGVACFTLLNSFIRSS